MPEHINCFVFRTANVHFVKEELERGRLRQGWGPPGTSLLDANGTSRTKEAWENAYRDAWGEDPSPRRYGILRRMLDMKEGDLVVCPKAPDYSCFTIATVSGPYRFEVAPDPQDFGHIIPVQDQRVINNWYDGDAQTIHELFKSAYFRSAVTQVQDSNRERVLDAARRLREKEDTRPAQNPEAIRKQRSAEARREAAKRLIEYVNQSWGFDQFEAAVGEAFVRKGYEYIRGKSDQKGGADADHILSIPMPGLDDLDSLDRPQYLLIVQVKLKKGVDNDDRKGVEQLSMWKSSEEEQVVARVLFSSADSFTEECKKLAEEKDGHADLWRRGRALLALNRVTVNRFSVSSSRFLTGIPIFLFCPFLFFMTFCAIDPSWTFGIIVYFFTFL